MPDPVKINGKLPPHAGANCYASAIDAARLAGEPRERRIALIGYDVGKTEIVHCRDDETGDEWDETVVTLRVRAIEEMHGDAAADAERMLNASRERREARGRDLKLSLFT